MNGALFQPINPPIHQSINPLSPIRAVTFDVGGTLIEPWPSVGHIYAAVAERHGMPNVPIDSLNRQFAAAWSELTAFDYTRVEWFNIVRQTFLGLIQTPLSGDFFSDLYRQFELPESWRVFDDVRPALESLNALGLKLGIISNWDQRLRPLLRVLNLDHYLDTIVISCEAGTCKPSTAIFEQAATALALPARSLLHVGDSPTLDVSGAIAAGFQSLLLARGQTSKAGQISSLLELQSHVSAANQGPPT
jgi:putative hydrolase of the HAD superfamily